MGRRQFLASFGAISLGGCLRSDSLLGDSQFGTVTCADGLQQESPNGPASDSWPTYLHDMQNTGQTEAQGPTGCVETKWTWTQNPQAPTFAGPVVTDSNVYIPHQVIDKKQFVVLDAGTGEKKWEYTNPRFQLVPRYTPTVSENQLILTDTDNLASVDLQDRNTTWFRDLSDSSSSPPGLGVPRAANGLVYVGVDTGKVYAFDSDTGEQKWVYDIEGVSIGDTSAAVAESRRNGTPYAPIAVTGKRVYVTSWSFSLTALDAVTGERQWRFSPGKDDLDMMHAPVIVDDKVYTQTESAILYVLNATTGNLLWKYDAMGKATDGISPIVDNDSVYITAGTSTENLFLVALSKDNRSMRWKRQVGPPFVNPVADASTIYIGYSGGLHAIKKGDGNEKWTLEIQNELAAPGTIVDGTVYAADTAGNLYGVW